jgi:ParB family chromosome partitioning protein
VPESWQGVSSASGRGIGRGLAAILAQSERETEGLRHLALDLIRPNPRQPRRQFDGEALLALSESIKARGILQPLVVRPLAGGTFELVAGERRLRAARLAGLDAIPALVRETEEAEQLELALIENVAREDLNPVEEARACATLVDDLGVTKEELGRRIGRSRVAVSNLIRLLDLPDVALEQISRPRDPHLPRPGRPPSPRASGQCVGLVGPRDRATGEERWKQRERGTGPRDGDRPP